MEQLLVRLGCDAALPIHWMVWSENEQEIIASGVLDNADALNTLSDRAGQRPVIALVPSTDVLLRWVSLPPKASRKVLSAIPFMLEDDLASSIDAQFFAYGPRNQDQQAVAIVRRDTLENWKRWLDQAGIYCETMLPDVLAVPHNPSGWATLQLGDTLLVRQDSWQGIGGEPQWLIPALNQLSQASESPKHVVHYSDTPLSDLNHVTVTTPPLEMPLHILMQEAQKSTFNLLQGEFKVKRKSNSAWRQWRLAAVLAGIALVSSAIDKGLTIYQLKAQNAALNTQINTLVKGGFPNIGAYRDVRRKLTSELAKLEQNGGSTSMLVMMEQLADSFAASKVKPQSLRFDAARSEIRMQAIGDSFESLERFRRQAEQAGFVVEQGAINNRNDKVIGTVALRSAV